MLIFKVIKLVLIMILLIMRVNKFRKEYHKL